MFRLVQGFLRNLSRSAVLSFVAGLLSLLLFAANLGAHASDDTAPKTFKGRVIAPAMSYQGAGWLERPDREATEQPEKVLDALKIAPGSTVADIGSGTGYFSLRLAKRVGPQGRVLATDIQPQMLALLDENRRAAGTRNIEPILCTPTDAKLPAGQLDLALMVDVYHELAYPEETMAQVRRALKPDGRLVLVEYRGEDASVPIKPEHKMTLAQVRAEIEPMGFQVQEVLEFLAYQRVIVFKKTRNAD
ncbi:MAG TPA: methyltransferase domain-containing protein [Candidatus Binatia bacterium]|jgi:SAM-dependent methyltransferase|nr:methyltransferase domain-containing protein [Candidatus Binatia bacterium]